MKNVPGLKKCNWNKGGHCRIIAGSLGIDYG